MHPSLQLTTAINPTSRSSRECGTRAFLLIPLALVLAWLVLAPTARAVTPAPDGGYPNGNTAEGDDALFSLTTGLWNTAIGFDALYFNTAGKGNTAIGFNALYSNTSDQNTAIGYLALQYNTTGVQNTATGYGALNFNTTGFQNAATGFEALQYNTTGRANTAMGYRAMYTNTIGQGDVAIGTKSLYSNTTGQWNTAVGAPALQYNTTGSHNTAIGYFALRDNTTGEENTASGESALDNNPIGSHNVAMGYEAGNNTTGSDNILLGYEAGDDLTSGSNDIEIGNSGVAAENNTIRIGTVGTHTNVYVAGISGVTVADGVGVIVDTNGHLGTIVSSKRFKDEIKPMDKASEAILGLQPVTFRYKHELDPKDIPQFGLVAEEVEKVNPALVARDDQGKPYTVRYEAVNAMLLNEFLKEHRRVEELKASAAEQQKEIKKLASQLKEQASQIQKVSDQLEASKPARRLVVDNQ
jgi:hypothetical protein